jgi:hypothetical protein
MKISKEFLKRLIVEQVYHSDENIGMALHQALEELKETLQDVQIPDAWAEKYPRSARKLIGNIDRVIDALYRMGR